MHSQHRRPDPLQYVLISSLRVKAATGLASVDVLFTRTNDLVPKASRRLRRPVLASADVRIVRGHFDHRLTYIMAVG
jgi:hypothetical protein